ncbi:hypothetical protein DFH11DRAFT_1685688 [Phellopilus nigrolimitatus]|nr:hypothetical protein DFH11DRAFT_1685688 [Phellopilus nigrolimitatus]
MHGARHDAHDRVVRDRATANVTARGHSGTSDSDWKLAKRFSGMRFTNYATGQGACGGTNSDSDFVSAHVLNAPIQYGGGQDCYKMITISYQGKSTQAQIVDECPGCPYGGLDMSPGLFAFFSSPDAGVIYGDWNFGSGDPTTSSKTPTSTWAPPPITFWSSSSTWSSSSSTSWSSSSSTWSSSSSTWSSSSSSSTSTSSTPSPTPTPTPTPSVTLESSLIDALDYAVMQIGGLFAASGQVNLQTADSA